MDGTLSLLGFCLAFACALVLSGYIAQDVFFQRHPFGVNGRPRRRRVYRRRPLPRNW